MRCYCDGHLFPDTAYAQAEEIIVSTINNGVASTQEIFVRSARLPEAVFSVSYDFVKVAVKMYGAVRWHDLGIAKAK